MMTVIGDQVSLIDLSKVVWLNYTDNLKNNNILTKNDLEYQENRRKRKVRKLNFGRAMYIDLEALTHEEKEVLLSEDCEDLMLHRGIFLSGPTVTTVLSLTAFREGYQMEKDLTAM